MKRAYHRNKYRLLGLLALIALDALSKFFVVRWIPPFHGSLYPFGGIGIFDFFGVSFSLNTVINTGAAWGVFPGHFAALLALRLAVAGAILAYLLFRRVKGPELPLWLIVAGALGNIVDMITYGHVIDFFHFRFFGWSFPVFNLADSCITIGVLLLLLWPKRQKEDANAN